MITYKLKPEEYNKLFKNYGLNYDLHEIFTCVKVGEDILLTDAIDREDIEEDESCIYISANTKVGKILMNYIDCCLSYRKMKDGSFVFKKMCYDLEWIDCEHYHCKNHIATCDICNFRKQKKSRYKIHDIRFIDPFEHRNPRVVCLLKTLHHELSETRTELEKNNSRRIKSICKAIKLLEIQVDALYQKWRYE